MQHATEEVLVHDASSTLKAANGQSGVVSRTPEELANIVSRFASSDGWLDRVRLRTENRWFERLYHGPDYDIWAISWMPGQSPGFHDQVSPRELSSWRPVFLRSIVPESRPS